MMYKTGTFRPVPFGAEDEVGSGCSAIGGQVFVDPASGKRVCISGDNKALWFEGPGKSKQSPVPEGMAARAVEAKRERKRAIEFCEQSGGVFSTSGGQANCLLPDGSVCDADNLAKGYCHGPKKETAASEPLDKMTLIVGGVLLAAGLTIALWPRKYVANKRR